MTGGPDDLFTDDVLLTLLRQVIDHGMETPPQALPHIYGRLLSHLEELEKRPPRGRRAGDSGKAARLAQIFMDCGFPQAKARKLALKQQRIPTIDAGKLRRAHNRLKEKSGRK